MNLKPLASNMTELQHGWYTTLFSYQTPVATIFWYGNEIKAYQTEKKWSATTTRHINKWLGLHPEASEVQLKPQEFFDNLLSEVK